MLCSRVDINKSYLEATGESVIFVDSFVIIDKGDNLFNICLH